MNVASPASIAVVGGGWAGCAAAVALAQGGLRVALFEQARTLGGRARRVGFDGMTLDNGQHVLIGAYLETLAAITAVHGAGRVDSLLHRLPLTLAPFGVRRAEGVALGAWRLPAPLNLAAGILAARGLTWRERLALLADFRRLEREGFRCPPRQTVAECFAASPARTMGGAWSPLCVAALNTPPSRASAQVFADVLREAFAGRAAHSDFLVPTVDLSTLFPDAAAQFIEMRGGTAHIGATVRSVVPDAHGVAVTSSAGREHFAAAVMAVGPHQLASALGDGGAMAPWRPILARVAAFAYESITTVYLAYPSAVPLPAAIARLDDAPGQWVFDRSTALPSPRPGIAQGLLAVVISASGPHDALDQVTLATAVDEQLRRLRPGLPKPMWSRVIAERRATYSCTPDLDRPRCGRIAPGLYLAGDYTDGAFPATLEAATRSGRATAMALIDDLRGDGAGSRSPG